MEVKTTIAKQPQSVRITSERQLDSTGIAALFLHVVVLDEREVDPARSGLGESLPVIVEDLRQQLASEGVALEMFNDRLLDAGYLDSHAPRFECRRFALRGEMTFRVEGGFPCVTERDLPEGIGDVSYALSLPACRPFAVKISELLAMLTAKEPEIRNKKRKRYA
jgi:hypothetical protein